MVDNLAEKVDACPLNWDCKVLFAYNWDRETCPLYGVAGCPLFRGCLSVEGNGRTVGTSELSVISWVSTVSVKRGSTVYGVKAYLNLLFFSL